MEDRNIETERLSLKVPTLQDQYYLWNILKNRSVWQYYMHIPERFKNDKDLFQESLDDWSIQEMFFNEKIDNLDKDSDMYSWTIHLKDGTVIGQMTVQPNFNYPDNPRIRNVGWYIDPNFQGKGYAYEASFSILKYMFTSTDILEIQTEANTINIGSWKLMEKLGFTRCGESLSSRLDDLGNRLTQYDYRITKEEFLAKNPAKRVR